MSACYIWIKSVILDVNAKTGGLVRVDRVQVTGPNVTVRDDMPPRSGNTHVSSNTSDHSSFIYSPPIALPSSPATLSINAGNEFGVAFLCNQSILRRLVMQLRNCCPSNWKLPSDTQNLPILTVSLAQTETGLRSYDSNYMYTPNSIRTLDSTEANFVFGPMVRRN